MIMHWLVFIIGIILIIVHGFWQNLFIIDAITVLILFILSIPFFAQYLKKAKFPGAEFEFKDEIRETQKLVELSIQKAKEAESFGKASILQFETFKLSSIRNLLDSDPVLSLAALRIEVERKLRSVAVFLGTPKSYKLTISKLIEVIRINEMLSFEQINALRNIIDMCNKAIHGYLISKEEAMEIIELTEELNKSFSIGYSIDFSENPDYEKHGLVCEFEHCIEMMPILEEPTENSCQIFGHECPLGFERVSNCTKTIKDIPSSRFIKS